ncbi:MAG: hypothetical protein HY664_05115 [Chloroflexi bacterium]|nr:hypothetical protein [Chloroflexota bacterium]
METKTCLKCGGSVSGKFRLVWDKNHYVHLCQICSRRLEALVDRHGDIGPISTANRRFMCWVQEDRFMSYEEYLGIKED